MQESSSWGNQVNNIIYFTPRKDLSAQKNLADFIRLSKEHLVIWGNLPKFDWESERWFTTYQTIRFINYENSHLHPSTPAEPHQLLHPAFMEFAKAYIRYQQSMKQTRQIAGIMQAMRVLEFVLREDLCTPDITQVSQRHFDNAISYLSNDYQSAASIASNLLRILRRSADYYIVTDDANYWSHPFVGRRSYFYTNGGGAPQVLKDKKVVDQDALLAIGEVFGRGFDEKLEDVDVMITSITAILLSAPMRINETVRFRDDCLDTDTDKDGNVQHYLKFWVPKTKEYARKAIPTVMAECTIEAFRRLREITEDARRLARYLETNPSTFYRHANCPKVPDNQELTPCEVAEALGLSKSSSVTTYLKRQTGAWSVTGFTLNSLWKLVMEDHSRTNPHFPYQQAFDGTGSRPPRMSESLLCTLRHQFSTRQKTSPVLLTPFSRSYYAVRLAAQLKNGDRPLCFFMRHGFPSIQLRSHGIRHFLNRIAKHSGVSIEVITAWSNRSSDRQTLTYLDNDEGEAASETSMLTGISNVQEPKDPIIEAEAAAYRDGPIHRSRYGLCRRSWRIGPCNKFGDCLNCSEVLICKGDRVATNIIAIDRDNLVATYNAAQEAISRGERSATRWLTVAAPQIQRLNNLLAILNDPLIEDGSPIEIVGSDFNHEQTLVNEKAIDLGVKLVDRKKLSIEYGAELLMCLDELRSK